jgi:hypothetical protein
LDDQYLVREVSVHQVFSYDTSVGVVGVHSRQRRDRVGSRGQVDELEVRLCPRAP